MLRKWLVAGRHQAIIWPNIDLKLSTSISVICWQNTIPNHVLERFYAYTKGQWFKCFGWIFCDSVHPYIMHTVHVFFIVVFLGKFISYCHIPKDYVTNVVTVEAGVMNIDKCIMWILLQLLYKQSRPNHDRHLRYSLLGDLVLVLTQSRWRTYLYTVIRYRALRSLMFAKYEVLILLVAVF